jgi:two-component SAPR family response regulator
MADLASNKFMQVSKLKWNGALVDWNPSGKADETFWYILIQQKKSIVICLMILHYWLTYYIGVTKTS